ncbi:MAG TPA: extensin family protein [Polyangiales bacterium]|nr:extensin family protein [Polyangiales bacterium]
MTRTPAVCALVALAAWVVACCPQAFHSHSVARNTSLASETAEDVRRISVGRDSLPSGRAITGLSARECTRLLQSASVRFDPISKQQTPAIRSPIELHSSVLGVQFAPANGMAKYGYVDCRLAVALLAWAPILRDAGVTKVEHYSTFRPGARVRGSGKVSGHAHALAIDAARFHLTDGRVIVVLNDWDERERGGAPCPVRASEDREGRILRSVVCRAVERDLFQVVLTPHHDRDHQNHVHMELVPDIAWSYVR